MKNKLFLNMTAGMIAFTINVILSFFIYPHIVRSVGGVAYGFVALANNFINYALLITTALNSMACRFVAIKIHEHDYDGANRYFNSVLISNCVIASMFLFPLLYIVVFLDKIVHVPINITTDVKILFTLIFTNFIINIIFSSFGVATLATNKLHLSLFRKSEAHIICAVLLILLFVLLTPRVLYVGISAIITTIYVSIFNLKYTKELLPELKVFRKKYFSFSVIKELVASGIWNTFSQLGAVFSSGLDLLVANLFINASAMGTLSISKIVPTFILTSFDYMAKIFFPQFLETYAKNNISLLKKQLLFSIKLFGLFAGIPVIILFIYGDVFYSLWVPAQNAITLQWLSIVSCVEFIFLLPIEALWHIFTITNKLKISSTFVLTNSILTIIIVLISLNFIDNPTIKIFIIAGVSSIFGVFRALTLLPAWGAMCLGLKWNTFYPYIFKNTLAFCLITSVSYCIRRSFIINNWAGFFIICLTTCIFGFILNWFLLFGKEERQIVLSFMLKKIRKG